MQVIRTSNYCIEKESVVAFGKFDGVHKGHQKLIKILCEEAKKDNKLSIITCHRSLRSGKNLQRGIGSGRH